MSSLALVVPTYQRQEHLRTLLSSVDAAHQRCGPDLSTEFVVIVVIDGSTDNSEAVAKEFSSTLPLEIIKKENGGLASARNAGWRAAEGTDQVWFLDDDMTVSADALLLRLQFCETNAPNTVLFGPCWIESPQRQVAYLVGWHHRLYSRLAEAGGSSDPVEIHFANTSVPTDLLRTTGGFNESLVGWGGEDNEFAYRLLERGTSFLFDLRADAVHNRERSHIGQIANWRDAGRNLGRIYQQHPELGLTLAADFDKRRLITFVCEFQRLRRLGLLALGPVFGLPILHASQFLPGRLIRWPLGVSSQATHILGLDDVDAAEEMISAVAGMAQPKSREVSP